MFVMTDEDLACQVPIFSHQYDCPSVILINESSSPYSNINPCEIILKNNETIRYSNAITQTNNELMNLNNRSDLKNASTVTEYNISNSLILNEDQSPQLIRLDEIFENDDMKYSDDEIMLSNDNEEEDIDDDEILDDNSNQAFLYNNFIPPNGNPNILVPPNNINQNKIIIPAYRERVPRKNRITLTPEARRFRDSFYKCYGDKKRFSKLVVRNIHNSICGQLGLPKMTRAEYRSILLYFNNYAPYRQKIIHAINMKKSILFEPLINSNARLFSVH